MNTVHRKFRIQATNKVEMVSLTKKKTTSKYTSRIFKFIIRDWVVFILVKFTYSKMHRSAMYNLMRSDDCVYAWAYAPVTPFLIDSHHSTHQCSDFFHTDYT